MRSKTDTRTLAEALEGADVVLRPFGQGRVDAGHGQVDGATSRSSSPWPIPIRRSPPRRCAQVRDDAIMATGRSDYPNQVNNVLGFPYHLPRRARRARDHHQHGDEDRRRPCAGRARARGRARRGGRRLSGRAAELRARLHHPGAVRSAADLARAAGRRQGGDGYRRRAQADRRHGRLPPAAVARGAIRSPARCSAVFERAAPAAQARRLRRGRGGAGDPRRGELRAPGARHARSWSAARIASRETAREAGIELGEGIEIINAAAVAPATRPTPTTSTSGCSAAAILLRDCQRLVNQDRNHFAACMVALGDADAMVTGVTRNFSVALEDVRRVIDPKPGHRVIGVSLVLARGRTVLVADTAVTEMPNAEELADIADRGGGRGAPPRLRAARRAARLLHLRPSAGRALGARAGGGAASSTSGASISNTTARWPPTSRSTRSWRRPIRSAGCPARPTCW